MVNKLGTGGDEGEVWRDHSLCVTRYLWTPGTRSQEEIDVRLGDVGLSVRVLVWSRVSLERPSVLSTSGDRNGHVKEVTDFL